MLLLTSTSDKIELVTSGSSISIDVHASFLDYTGSAIIPSRQNTHISSATTSTIISSPSGSSTQRNVKEFHIRNKGVEVVTITVRHTDGTTTVELRSEDLDPNDELQYTEGLGFLRL